MNKNEKNQSDKIDIKNSNKVTGNSINEHRIFESGNILISEKEIRQQNENL